MSTITQSLLVDINARDRASSALQRLRQKAESTFGSIGKAAKVAFAVVAVGAAAALGGIAATVNVAAEFQQSMAQVQAVTGATGAEFQQLKDLAKDMGATTAFSASEAAAGITFLGQAGFKTDQIMTALPSTLSLAAAGNLALGQAADIASNVLSGMRLPVESLSGVVDGLAATAASSNTNVQQLGEGFKMAAPGAAAAGVEFKEVAASLGVLADNGIQASSGGTALNAALRTMLKPSKEAEELTRKLGLSFVDTQGQIRPMVDIVGDLEKKQLSAKDALVIFGEEGGRAINALVGSGSERLRALQTTIEDSGGAAQRMADIQMATFEGALKSLSSATEGVMINIGERFLPILTDLVNNYVVPAVRAFNEWIDAVGGVGQMFDDAVGLVAGFGSSVTNILHAVFSDGEFREKYLGQLGATFSAGVTLATNFITHFIQIYQSAAGLVWEPLQFAFGLIWEPIKQIAVSGINAVAEQITGGINRIIRGVNRIGESFGIAIGEVDFTPLSVDAPRSIEERYAIMRGRVRQRMAEIGERAEAMSADISKDAAQLGEEVAGVWGVVESKVDDRVKHIVVKYKDETKKILPATESTAHAAGKAIVDHTVKGIEEQAPHLESAGQRSMSKMLGGLNDMLKGATGIGKTLIDGFSSVLQGGSFSSALQGIGQSMGQLIGGPLGAVVSTGVSGVIKLATGLFSGDSKAEKRRDVIGELQSAVSLGNINHFQSSDKLGDITNSLQSSKATVDAVKQAFGISVQESAELVKMLQSGNRDASSLSRFNDLLGANQNKSDTAVVASLLHASTRSAAPVADTKQASVAEETAVRAGGVAKEIVVNEAAGYLRSAFIDQRFSRSRLRGYGRARVGEAVGMIGGPLMPLRQGLLDLADGGSPDLMPFEAQHIDIVAARGVKSVLHRPGRGYNVKVGEVEPEFIEVKSARSGSSGNSTVHYHEYKIYTIDGPSTERFFKRQGRRYIEEIVEDVTDRGKGLVNTKALTSKGRV